MFEQAFVRTRRPWTVAASFSGQVLFVGVMALVPLLQTGVIAPGRLAGILIAQPPGAPPRAIESHPNSTLQRARNPLRVFTGELRQPSRVPNEIPAGDGEPLTAFIFDCDGPDEPRIISALGPSQVTVPAPVESAPAAPSTATPARVRVGGAVQAGKILRQVTPLYPAIAKQARISGQVRLEAIIAKNGRIENLQVTSGHPLLVQAALEAVRQWVYRPTLLNGEPVEVVTLIDVNFGL